MILNYRSGELRYISQELFEVDQSIPVLVART